MTSTLNIVRKFGHEKMNLFRPRVVCPSLKMESRLGELVPSFSVCSPFALLKPNGINELNIIAWLNRKSCFNFCTFFARTHEQNLSVDSSGALIETAIIHNQMDMDRMNLHLRMSLSCA